ncbi:alpha/beta hydrolase [Serratia marcescens]
MNITVSDVRIPLAEAEQSSPLLALRVYTREGDTALQAPYPVVVMCHGFCGVQGLLLPDIACRFVHEGYVVVTFDYRGFGDSGGERGRITPAGQQEDILAVLHWVLACPVLDEGRVALWGAGLGGGHVLCIAAMTPWVRCVISQMPVIEGRHLVTGGMKVGEQEVLLRSLRELTLRQRISGEELWVPMRRVLRDRASQQFVRQHRTAFPDIAMRIPYLTLDALLDFCPMSFAGDVGQPTLIVAAEDDPLTPTVQVRHLRDALGGYRRLCMVKGAGHYDVYAPPEAARVLSAQCDWLRRFL